MQDKTSVKTFCRFSGSVSSGGVRNAVLNQVFEYVNQVLNLVLNQILISVLLSETFPRGFSGVALVHILLRSLRAKHEKCDCDFDISEDLKKGAMRESH